MSNHWKKSEINYLNKPDMISSLRKMYRTIKQEDSKGISIVEAKERATFKIFTNTKSHCQKAAQKRIEGILQTS